MSASATSHWHSMARHWTHIGPPLRPDDEDMAYVREAVMAWSSRHQRPARALILGVTPELHRALTPQCATVRAADHTAEMIQRVWPGRAQDAAHADWQRLPYGTGEFDIACCDGGLHLLDAAGQRDLAASLARVVAPGGTCVLRLFEPPAARETADTVFADLRAGRIISVHEFKVRLTMAMHEDRARGVRLADVWDAVQLAAPDLDVLAKALGWPTDQACTLTAYQGAQRRYHFATRAEVESMFCREAGGWHLHSVHRPGYNLGERFPTVVLTRDE